MAIVSTPTDIGICALLNQLSDRDIVLATSELDFKDWSACEIGAKISDNPEMVGDNYDYLVLNPGTNCIERYPKPETPVYDSELLAPWSGDKYWAGTFPATTGYIANQELALPVFTVDVNIMATFSIGINADKVEWLPTGPIQTSGATYGTGHAGFEATNLPVIKDVTGYGMRSYFRKVFVKAGQSGLKLAIYLPNTGGSGWSHHYVPGFTSINAIAFKA